MQVITWKCLQLTPGSGLGYLEELEEKQALKDRIEADPSTSKFILDYRQKPDGYLNYLSTELRYDPATDEYESILIPDNDPEQLKSRVVLILVCSLLFSIYITTKNFFNMRVS